jgi:4-amino-4-deoxy-L-arabinose transferase-like glycosyltransferase
LIFALAVVVHLGMVGAIFWQEAYPAGSADEARYVFYAESLRAGRGLHAPGYEERPTAYVMPNLPLLFAALGPDSLVRLRVGQLVLCALVAVGVYHLGARAFHEPRIGLLGVVCLLANLAWVQQPAFLLTEPLFTLLLLLAIGLLIVYPHKWTALAGAGFALGLAWLTRGALFGVLALLFPYLLWRQGWRPTLLVGVVMGLVISPWVVRNYFAFGEFVATSTQSGNVVAGAYNNEIYKNPWGDGWINPDLIHRERVSDELFNDEIAYANYLSEQGLAWIRQNPDKLPKLWAAHVLGFVRPWFKVARNDTELAYEFFSWCVAVALIAYGAWQGWRQKSRPLGLMALVVAGGFVTGLIFFAIPRYRLPYAPYFALFQAFALWQIWLRLPKREAWRLGRLLGRQTATQ